MYTCTEIVYIYIVSLSVKCMCVKLYVGDERGTESSSFDLAQFKILCVALYERRPRPVLNFLRKKPNL